MTIDQAIFRHDDLDLPDPILLTSLPDYWVPKLTFLTDHQASTATAVAGGAASLAAAREDRFRAKADLDKGESQSVVDSSITKKHLDALRDRLTRAVKREKVAEADDARTRRIHADAQQPVVSTTRLLNGRRTFTPPPENSGVYQTIADRGWITLDRKSNASCAGRIVFQVGG